ncbi:hypothetical protein [Mycoplasmopsis arginini]|uniref:hypothetical protein n=1 Tax=Mycoplasmopsis arginini TaxID=2094 RepID=UPI00249E7288|nr:hypothetical protein [Mycoplasmopsis arginini]MDI3350482.1 hypothetical protein [Mycoplasmopsis arginini]MDI3350806.1 hypothetical protein [Mycoplasmopsis arginini]
MKNNKKHFCCVCKKSAKNKWNDKWACKKHFEDVIDYCQEYDISWLQETGEKLW